MEKGKEEIKIFLTQPEIEYYTKEGIKKGRWQGFFFWFLLSFLMKVLTAVINYLIQ